MRGSYRIIELVRSARLRSLQSHLPTVRGTYDCYRCFDTGIDQLLFCEHTWKIAGPLMIIINPLAKKRVPVVLNLCSYAKAYFLNFNARKCEKHQVPNFFAKEFNNIWHLIWYNVTFDIIRFALKGNFTLKHKKTYTQEVKVRFGVWHPQMFWRYNSFPSDALGLIGWEKVTTGYS